MKTDTSYRDLDVWNLAMDLSAAMYEVTQTFPKEELFGLTSQMRRSDVSVPVNIAEGSGRKTRADFAHFLHIAAGSLRELETLIFLAARLRYLQEIDHLLEMTGRVGQMNTKLRKSLLPQ